MLATIALDRAAPAGATAPATILQQDFDFVPAVTAIRAGTRVTFPNRDKREHHLKSSGVQSIEFRIYDAKSTPEPMAFDKTGTTVLFCYLHDWMKAYIHVVDTPFFAKTERTGVAVLEDLPEGRYRVVAWHPDLAGESPAETVTVSARGTTPLNYAFQFKPRHIGRIRPAAGAAPSKPSSSGY